MSKRKKYIILRGQPEENKCIACNGTGYYDDTDSPKCSSCKGTGLNLSDSNRL